MNGMQEDGTKKLACHDDFVILTATFGLIDCRRFSHTQPAKNAGSAQ